MTREPVQKIEAGQVWRRKKTGKLIRIVRESMFWSQSDVAGRPLDDFSWEGFDYKGRGQSYGSYIRRDYELVGTVGKDGKLKPLAGNEKNTEAKES